MHIGTVRTALFNYLFAKHHKGTYFVRIEDTDKERNRAEWVDAIWEDFAWCGLEPDEKYIQSEHVNRHRELLKKLVDRGVAYISKEPKKDEPSKIIEVVRLKNPGTKVTFADAVRGKVTFETTELGDFVIARSIDDPLYHFAVVVDDGDAHVSHILRAEEHISNTPRQILIQEALGFPRPIYAHFPLILAPDRSKLSKRRHGASIEQYRAQGYLPEALINYLALLGWNPGTPQELFSMRELIETFSLDGVQKSGAIFDAQKLRWFNGEYLKRVGEEAFEAEVAERLAHADIPESAMAHHLLPLLRERMCVWSDIDALLAESGELHFVKKPLTLNPKKISWREEGAEDARMHLTHCRGVLFDANPEMFESPEQLKKTLWPYAEEKGRGNVLWPLRYGLTGQEKSPDPFTVLYILGREESLRRIDSALGIMK